MGAGDRVRRARLVGRRVAVFELIISWQLVRVALLVVTTVGTLWILAFLAELSVHPHLVIEVDAGPAGTAMIRRVRFSADHPRDVLTALRKAAQPAR